MIGFTNNIAGVYAKEGITCNAVAPGLVKTDMLPSSVKPENTPMGRLGKPEEVASVVSMLATNGYVNGQTINVDGGIHKK